MSGKILARGGRHVQVFREPNDHAGRFFLPFGGKLNKENRWVQLAFLVPWWKVEQRYADQFKLSRSGQEAMPVRVALGALIIQQRLNLSDRETVRQITENPYLQYFIGLPHFQEEPPFHPSLMTHFRKRLSDDVINQVNDWIITDTEEDDEDDNSDYSVDASVEETPHSVSENAPAELPAN